MTRGAKGSIAIFVSLIFFCGLGPSQTTHKPSSPDSVKGNFPPAHRKYIPSDSPIHIRGGSVYASHPKSDWTLTAKARTYVTEFKTDPPYTIALDQVGSPPGQVTPFTLQGNWKVQFSFRDRSGTTDQPPPAAIVSICSQPDCALGNTPIPTRFVYMIGDVFGTITRPSSTELRYGITHPLSPLADHVFRVLVQDGSGTKNYLCVYGDCTVDIGP